MTSVAKRLQRKFREGRTDALMHRRGYLEWRRRLRDIGMEVAGKSILDIGTGDRAPLAIQFAADQACVTALDVRPVHLGRRRPFMWADLTRTEGVAASARAIATDVIHTARYWNTLAQLVGHSLPFNRVTVVQGDASSLPFNDAQFDIVVTSAVWEHLADISGATREVRRVLRPGGVAVIQIALFPSLLGGHYPEWHDPLRAPSGSRPWEHLREDHKPFPLYLNGLAEGDYRAVFDSIFPEAEWEDGQLVGESFLTDAVRAELWPFTDRDLLLTSATAWLRRDL